MTLEEFKQRLCKLVGRERNLYSDYRDQLKRIRAARDYKGCIFALYGKAISENRNCRKDGA